MQNRIQTIFQAQSQNQYSIAQTSAAERRKKLKALIKAVSVTYRQAIRDAMFADFGKSADETDMTEIFATVSELKEVSRNLSRWTNKHRVGTPLPLIGSSSWIKYEPKGVCLIISPWNFPVLLTIGPLATAIGAGNTVVLKPSEMTPHTSAVMAEMIQTLFPPEEVAIVEGGIEVSTELLALPFNHIFFTGSPTIGKVVMSAAAKNLTSVTLELGGKSPTIVDETANIKTAAQRIIWAKMLNAGQVCIAPDYVLVHESVVDKFIHEAQKSIEALYGVTPETSSDYTYMVNEKHQARVSDMLEKSLVKGGKLICGGIVGKTNKTVSPTLVLNPPLDSPIMQDEIFGPILPIIPYKSLNEAIALIRSKEKPLALYIFSSNNRHIRQISDQTSAGGTTINHCAVHFFNGNLPFGGVNNSGIGKGHGFAGFKAFSNERGFFRQHTISITDILKPPHAAWKQKVLDLAIKWL